MFSTSTAKRVAREAEKIVSLKEDMDAVSWTRVLEIGNQLQEGVDEAERVSLARELVSIAQSNRSLYTRLGLDPEPSSSRVMASGIEVMEGGLAEAAIEKRGDRGGRRPPIIEAPSIEPEVFVDPAKPISRRPACRRSAISWRRTIPTKATSSRRPRP